MDSEKRDREESFEMRSGQSAMDRLESELERELKHTNPKLEIDSVKEKIDRLETEIREAEDNIKSFFKERRAADDFEFQYWLERMRDLRKKEHDLRKKEHDLHEEKKALIAERKALIEKESQKEHDLHEERKAMIEKEILLIKMGDRLRDVGDGNSLVPGMEKLSVRGLLSSRSIRYNEVWKTVWSEKVQSFELKSCKTVPAIDLEGHPKRDCDENREFHPFFCQKIVGCVLGIDGGVEGTGEEVGSLSFDIGGKKVYLSHTFKTNIKNQSSEHSIQPDFVITYSSTVPSCAYDVRSVIEIKKPGTMNTDESLGQIVSYLAYLLSDPLRKVAFGLLTDCEHVMVFKMKQEDSKQRDFDPTKAKLYRTDSLLLDTPEGAGLLCEFLMLSDEALMYSRAPSHNGVVWFPCEELQYRDYNWFACLVRDERSEHDKMIWKRVCRAIQFLFGLI